MVDWHQMNETFFNALQVERNVMFLILTLIILVAALNIISGLIMLVKDKGRDIAILRTIRAARRHLARVLFFRSSIGIVGRSSSPFARRLGSARTSSRPGKVPDVDHGHGNLFSPKFIS